MSINREREMLLYCSVPWLAILSALLGRPNIFALLVCPNNILYRQLRFTFWVVQVQIFQWHSDMKVTFRRRKWNYFGKQLKVGHFSPVFEWHLNTRPVFNWKKQDGIQNVWKLDRNISFIQINLVYRCTVFRTLMNVRTVGIWIANIQITETFE